MTPEQRARFERHGWIHWRGALGKTVGPLRERVLAELKRSGKGMRHPVKDIPVFQQISKLSSMIRIPDLHACIATPEIVSAMRALAAPEQLQQASDAQLLLSPPRQGEWTLARLNWHTDLSAPGNRLPGIQLFVLIDDVLPKGGGTLAISGSHVQPRLARADAMDIRALLKREADPRKALTERGFSIVEMTGAAGDVYLMDMRLLHTPSVNASPRPRIMATQRFLATE